MSRYQAADVTRWARVKADWRAARDTLPLAFAHLKEVLSAEEYERMVREYRSGEREVRIDNNLIVTCLTLKN